MTKRTGGGAKPRIVLTATDHDRLSALADAAFGTMPEVAAALAEELDRAQILPAGRRPADTVAMGCAVDFRDDVTAKVQTVTLVYPHEADISQGRISVLTPIGTALIGLPVGKSIGWITRNGESKRLTVLQVREPAAADRVSA